MKKFLIALLFLTGVLANMSPTEEENLYREHFETERSTAILACATCFDIEINSVIESLSHFIIPDDDNFKCWYNCYLMKMGIKKDQMIIWDLAKNFTKLYLMDDKYDQNVELLYANCQLEVPTNFKNQCQVAYELILCEVRNWFRVGLPSH